MEKSIFSKLDNNKFIVLNTKRFYELNAKTEYWRDEHPAVTALKEAINAFITDYVIETGKSLDQKYIVVNQDEPYAEKVAEIIFKPSWRKEADK